MGVVLGFLATLLGALFGASFGSFCSIEYGGLIGATVGLLTGLIGSHYGWSCYCAARSRRQEYRFRMEWKAEGRRRKRTA
jgi:hypothetical protein